MDKKRRTAALSDSRCPQFTAVNEYAMNGNNDLYHSFQVNLQRRLSQGLRLNANYTFSRDRYYDQTSVVNVRKYRTVAATDYPNMLRIFATYDLPFGRDQAFASKRLRWADYAVDPGEREYLTLLHERTGKPLLVTEWSVPARDSGLYVNYAHLDWSFPQTVATQQQRGRQAAEFLTQLYNLPFVVGAHWFTWSDIDTKERQANRGLFKANNDPWPELQDALTNVTKDIP